MDVYGIAVLRGLPALRVIDQVIQPRRLDVHLQRRATSIVCPRCPTCCCHVQESRPRCLRDLPLLGRPVPPWVHLRRFACPDCHHRPWEQRETCGEPVKWTERLYNPVRQAYRHGCPCRQWARRSGLSARPVCRWTCERSRGGRPRQLGRALGMDEDARRKGPRYHTLSVDLDKGKAMATFKGRRAKEVIAWFQRRPQAERDQVEGVVREMSKTSAAAIGQLFGETVHVMDRFHGVHLAVGALDGVLRSVSTQLDAEAAKSLKKLRKRWLQSANPRDVDALLARDAWRRRFPALREVIDWVQTWRRWFERTSEKPAREAFLKLIERASPSALEPLQRMAGTWSRWFEPIARYRRYRYTNGMTEGLNNQIKLMQRRAYGLRNEHNRRKRI